MFVVMAPTRVTSKAVEKADHANRLFGGALFLEAEYITLSTKSTLRVLLPLDFFWPAVSLKRSKEDLGNNENSCC